MNKFSSKISYIIVTFFMAAIIISFALTGFQGFSSSADAVATVDGTPISISEYNQMLNSQIQRYSQYFGGKSLTSQQIRQFRIKESTLQTLVQQKLMQNLASNMKFDSSETEMKEEIKKTPFFLTDGKFDVNKYKAILGRNNYSPSKYEIVVKNEIATKKLTDIFSSMQVSDNYAKDILKFKKNTVTVTGVEFDKESMTKYIDIQSKEVKTFVADKKNEAILKSLFNSMKKEFNKEARVKARHILLKVGKDAKEADVLAKAKKLRKKLTAGNFAKIAGKETQDPSGKGKKGGDLGWFTKGRMVPEFEKTAFSMKPGQISQPIKTSFGYHIIYVQKKEKEVKKTLAQVKNKVAKRHLQKSNRKALNALVEKVRMEAKAALDKNNKRKLNTLKEKYNITINENIVIDEFNQSAKALSMAQDKIALVFSDTKQSLIEDDGPIKVSMFKVVKRQSDEEFAKEIVKSLKSEVTAQNRNLSNSIQGELLQALEKQSKVVTYPKLL